MERNLHSAFATGDSSAFSPSSTTSPSISFFQDPMFSGLQALLSLNPSLLTDYTATGLSSPSLLIQEPIKMDDYVAEAKQKNLMAPKTEPYLCDELASSQPFHYSKCPSQLFDSSIFQPLPQLQSVERQSFTRKRQCFDSLISSGLNTVDRDFQSQAAALSSASTVKPRQHKRSSSSLDAAASATMIPQSTLARQRRQKLSDKARCLQKLMPWDKKMDQATLFEEAYKYVKYLQAQLYALQAMPSDSGFLNDPKPVIKNGSVFYDLERLNRNQVLQVVVNSPVAQTMLYSQGFCVFSMEQLSLLKNFSERRLLLQQMMVDDQTSSKGFFNNTSFWVAD